MIPADDYATADEILREALVRIKRERENQADEVEALSEALTTARLLLAEAEVAQAAIEKLLDGDLYAKNDAILRPGPPTPAAEPAPPLVNWRMVRAPLDADWWAAAYAESWPLVVAPIHRFAAAELDEATPPTIGAPVKPSRPQGRAPALATDGRSIAQVQMDDTLAALIGLAGNSGEVTLSLSALAIRAKVPNGSILFTIRRLEEAGKIAVRKNSGPTGKPVPHTYVILGAAPKPVALTAGKPPVLLEPEGPWLGAARKPPAKSLSPEPEPAPCPPPEPGPVGLEAFIPDEIDRPYSEPCTLMNLRSTACHFPIGEPSPEQFYCAERAAPGQQYCADHGSSMWQGQRAKRANGAARP